MPQGWKFTKSDGTDHYTGKVNYREMIGREMVHPDPDAETGDSCGSGYHLGKTLRGAGEYCAPGAVFRCSYSRRDVLGEDDDKVRLSRLKVIEEVPAWKGYGPRGRQLQRFIDSLSGIPWFANVGKPYEKPSWAENMKRLDSWSDARSPTWNDIWEAAEEAAGKAAGKAAGNAAGKAAGNAAGNAAWEAARVAYYTATEIVGGIKDGYFCRLMEVYRAGHYPVSFDGRKLVVY